MNDLPKIINNKEDIKSKLILFADDAILIGTNPNTTVLIKDINKTIKNINVWFKTNLLLLNLGKSNFMHFITKRSSCIDGNIGYNNKLISNTSILTFLCLIIGDTLTSTSYIGVIVPKLSAASVAELLNLIWHMTS